MMIATMDGLGVAKRAQNTHKKRLKTNLDKYENLLKKPIILFAPSLVRSVVSCDERAKKVLLFRTSITTGTVCRK